MKTRFFKVTILILLLAGFISCKKEQNDTPPLSPIMTLNFTEKFIPDQLPVIVFLSYPDGKILLDTTCISNGTYVLYPPSGKTIPEKFMVTVVNAETFWHNFKVNINTYTNVAKGSEWTLQGTKPDTIGNARITLENLPTLSGPILYSNSGYHNLTFDPLDRTLLLYKLPDDLYIKIETAGGQLYKYFKDFLQTGNHTINMSNALQPESHPVSFPMQVENYEAELFGYKDADYDSPVPILADYLISDGLAVDSIHLHYPPSIFAGFHTKLMLQETYSSDDTWFFHTEGGIPNEFVKINADILSMQPKKGSMTIQTSGTFDMVAAHWEFVDYSLLFYEWQVFTSDSTSTVLLPEIAPAFKRMFSSISLDSLTFQYAELTDLQNLGSYNELINKLFDPVHPQQMDRFDASILRKNFSVRSKK
jgi:hypothetical protein